MQVLYPINEDHWSIIVFAFLKLDTDKFNEITQLKRLILGVQALVYSFFYSSVSNISVLFNFIVGARCQQDNSVENMLEKSILEDSLAIRFDDIANCLACHCLYLVGFVSKTVYYRSEQLGEILRFFLHND